MDDDIVSISTIVPAMPGWYILYFFHDHNDGRLEYPSPIIAWDIERKYQKKTDRTWHNVRPIAAQAIGSSDGDEYWCVKSPDGKYQYNDSLFLDEADIIETMKQTYEAARRQRQNANALE